MKNCLIIALSVLTVITFASAAKAVDPHIDTTNCDTLGRKNGIFYSSCYLRITGESDDTGRMQALLTNSIGRIVFNEQCYQIHDSLPVFPTRMIEGMGVGVGYASSGKCTDNTAAGWNNARIYMDDYPSWPTRKPVFTIGPGVSGVSIKNLTLVEDCQINSGKDASTCGYTAGAIGISAQGGLSDNTQALDFDFSNLRFDGFDMGISINANNGSPNEGLWRFDDVKMSHLSFYSCRVGLYVNSYNAGLDVRSIYFYTPAQNGNFKTYGVYMRRGTYTSMDMLIGDGPGSGSATALIYVQEHGTLSIKNSQSEQFEYDLQMPTSSEGAVTDFTYPITLINNNFQNKVYVRNATLSSIGNQYGSIAPFTPPTVTMDGSRVYSVGDKFCAEALIGTYCSADRHFTMTNGAKLMFSTLYDGSITSGSTSAALSTLKLGSVSYSNLGSADDGSLIYCTDCQQASTCTGSGSGAFAKRIAGSWKCN